LNRAHTRLFAFLLTVVMATGQVFAHETLDLRSAGIDGIYELKEVTAAGVYSVEEEAKAQEFVGHFLTIHGSHVVLPDSTLCHIASSEQVMLRDDFQTFGSAGGSWSEVGLIKTADDGYHVTEIRFDCDGPFSGMLIQESSNTTLLAYWAVYLILGQESD